MAKTLRHVFFEHPVFEILVQYMTVTLQLETYILSQIPEME